MERINLWKPLHICAKGRIARDVFLGELSKKREEVTGKRTTNRRKQLNIPAGKSISIADVEEARRTGNPTAAKKARSSSSTRARRPRKKSSLEDDIVEESSDSESSSDGQHDDNKKWSEEDPSDSEVLSESFNDISGTDKPNSSVISNTSDIPRVHGMGSRESTFIVDDFVVVNFEGKLFPGRVTEVKPEGYIVSTMERSKIYWKWPAREDAILYSKEEVLYRIEPPRPVGKRSFFEMQICRTYRHVREGCSNAMTLSICVYVEKDTYYMIKEPPSKYNYRRKSGITRRTVSQQIKFFNFSHLVQHMHGWRCQRLKTAALKHANCKDNHPANYHGYPAYKSIKELKGATTKQASGKSNTQPPPEVLHQNFSKRLDPYEKHVIPSCAIILDPRFKKLAFSLEEDASLAYKHAQKVADALHLKEKEGGTVHFSHQCGVWLLRVCASRKLRMRERSTVAPAVTNPQKKSKNSAIGNGPITLATSPFKRIIPIISGKCTAESLSKGSSPDFALGDLLARRETRPGPFLRADRLLPIY
ncbi:hypothetical protein J437_LFUL011966 [Ladona fulva]|uniref:Uncharacterized protein n=1 Tax=Ladona fulva TaxID=123851 RepID=A0A8K0P3Y5_LADFU|nr:hypothetical protein J437_LFUL011966 [Ladona fulva]